MSRTAIRDWATSHPIAALLLWFFSVGQALAFIPLFASSAGRTLPIEPFTIASTWIGLLLPAAYLTWRTGGRAGIRALCRQLVPSSASPSWFVAVLAVVPVASLGVGVLTDGSPVHLVGAEAATAVVVGLIGQTLVHLLTNNLWEEVAWTGFVQARLQQRHTPSRAVVLTAPLVGFQHLALVADNTPAAAALVSAVLVLLALPYRAAMMWLYNRTHSLLVVGVAHACGDAMVTGSVLGDAFLPALYERSLGPLHLFAFAVLGTAVWVGTRGRLGVRA